MGEGSRDTAKTAESGVIARMAPAVRRIVRGGLRAGLVAATIAGGAAAAEERCVEGGARTVWAGRTVSGDEIESVDGERIRLAGVEVPRPAPGGGDAAARGAARLVAEAARGALADRTEGRELTLVDLGADRHGRRRGHLYDTESGQWLQAELVAAGLLRVVPEPGEGACARALLAVEEPARTARLGLWGEALFAVRAAEGTFDGLDGGVAVVEGTVRSIGRSGRRIWLNFGDDIRRDFAAVLDDNDRETLRRAGFDVDRAKGRRVLLRGVVVWRGGPRIEIGVPEEIGWTKR